MSENVVQELESELAAELVDEYTEILMEEPILPPPPSHGQSSIYCLYTKLTSPEISACKLCDGYLNI
jgi:hypothetical protein